MIKDFLEKIKKLKANICVIGLGQVGLPTALTLSKSGFSVIGHDINKKLMSELEVGNAPFEEAGMQELLTSCKNSGKFKTSHNLGDCVNSSDIIIICVPTPISEKIQPNLDFLKNACTSLSDFLLENKLVIIESSIPPGTFKQVVLPLISKGKNVDKKIWAAYIPERLSPGNALSEIQTTPRVIGFEDEESGILAKSLYENFVKSNILITKSQVAELSKLVENSFRDVNIAFSNEISKICEKYGVDFLELIKISNSHPRVNLHMPGPGVGGPCLPKDPYLLLNPQGMPKIESSIISDSRKINDGMPYHVVEMTINALEENHMKSSDSTILVLGISYKGNVSDTRLSPSKEIISKLKEMGSRVLVYDPLTSETFGGEKIENIWDGISISNLILIITDHDEFKNLKLEEIKSSMKKTPIIVDTRRIFDSKIAKMLEMSYFAVGYGENKR